ncbi:Galectin-9 [Myotis brandtii]|uniref:Galectin n=1 Tax=Myotis brandtii TaxID=109478 RepID=S7NS34_MYOBR|nr:Galectin-9 [Myotis brandtii]
MGFSDNDIAFHFNPRFEDGGYVACNTRQKGQWGLEERMMINPFQMGIPFEISFLVENSGFQVIPFFRLTQGGDRYTLRYGHQIIVKGMFLPSGGNRFEVNFQTGLSDKDIAFHFSPRFEEGGYVVCNTKQKGRWEQEQKMNINPFQMGVPFVISFLVENSGFQVKVNGNFFMNYIHRVPHHRVDTISFTGGVEVTQISIEDTCAVPAQRMISEGQPDTSPCVSLESKEQKPKVS